MRKTSMPARESPGASSRSVRVKGPASDAAAAHANRQFPAGKTHTAEEVKVHPQAGFVASAEAIAVSSLGESERNGDRGAEAAAAAARIRGAVSESDSSC